MIKIALAQINPIVGDIEYNCAKIIDYIKQAKKKKVDLIVFPELALVGYPPEDLLLKDHFIEKNKKFLKLIQQKCTKIVALVGFVDKDKNSIYNSCAIIQNKKIIDVYRKIILPNYGIFDEKRYFQAGSDLFSYVLGDYKFAISICEDIWNEQFISSLKGKGFDFIVNASASPFHLGKALERERVLSLAAKKTKSFVFYCNLVGGQDEAVFDGTSKVFSSKGKLIACAKRFHEDLLIFKLNKKIKHPSRKVEIKEDGEAFSALRLGLYDYVKKNGFRKVVVGVSGGIDSAIVIALATIALGRKNVCALIMPSCYTSDETFCDAKKICQNLKIKYHVVDIEDILQPYLRDLKPYFKGKGRDKTEENIQARIRGNILMAFSNKFGYLVLNTGNKSEVSCGYCTLYGDMVGGFGVLKDVPKLLVYKLGRYINKIMSKKVIPESVFRRPPSAELRYNQRDTDALPAYELLDPILKLYVEEDYSLEQIAKLGFKKSLVKKIIKMVDFNEYKRRQAPVGIKITPRAFGKDRRMPVTNRFSQ
jgi:NAD+ synthase (glutamine-hydrolysing)